MRNVRRGWRGISWLVSIAVGLAGGVAWASAAPYEKACGRSLSDGFWGLFSPHNLISNALTRQGGRYYFATANGAIRSFDPASGDLQEVARRFSGIPSPLYVDAVKICGGERGGRVFCIERAGGKELWSRELIGEVRTQPQSGGGMIFFPTLNSIVYALDEASGKWLWQYRRDNPAAITLLGTSGVAVAEDRVFAGFADGALVAIHRQSGQPIWEKKLGAGGKIQDIDATPVLWRDSLLVAAYDGQFSRLDREGQLLWSVPLGLARAPLIQEAEGLAYVGSVDGQAAAVDLKSGRVLWQRALGSSLLLTPALQGGHLLYAAADGRVYLLERSSGRWLWTYRTDSNLPFGAVAGGNGFDLLTLRGEFFCLRPGAH